MSDYTVTGPAWADALATWTRRRLPPRFELVPWAADRDFTCCTALGRGALRVAGIALEPAPDAELHESVWAPEARPHRVRFGDDELLLAVDIADGERDLTIATERAAVAAALDALGHGTDHRLRVRASDLLLRRALECVDVDGDFTFDALGTLLERIARGLRAASPGPLVVPIVRAEDAAAASRAAPAHAARWRLDRVDDPVGLVAVRALHLTLVVAPESDPARAQERERLASALGIDRAPVGRYGVADLTRGLRGTQR